MPDIPPDIPPEHIDRVIALLHGRAPDTVRDVVLRRLADRWNDYLKARHYTDKHLQWRLEEASAPRASALTFKGWLE